MDICAANWNEADAANSAAAPDGAPEGMAPGGVNDVLRAHQGALKRWYNWTVPRLTAGTPTAYMLNYAVAPAALLDGMTHMVQFHAANGAAATLNVNGLGAVPIQYYAAGDWRALPPNLFGQDWIAPVTYTGGAYLLIGFNNHTGEIADDAGATPDHGTVFAYGQALSRTTYAGLFARYGTSHGAGDGSTTFNLPDLRDRVTMGRGDMGGTPASRITSVLSGFDSTLLGAAGGSERKSTNISVSGTASGNLSATTAGPSAPFQQIIDGSGSGVATAGHTHDFMISGSLSVVANGTAFVDGVQPSIVTNKAIRL